MVSQRITRETLLSKWNGGFLVALSVALCILQFTSLRQDLPMGLVLIVGGIQWGMAITWVQDEVKPFWGRVSVCLSVIMGTILLTAVLKQSFVTLLLAAYLLLNGIAMVLYATKGPARQRRWEWVALTGTVNSISAAIIMQTSQLAFPMLSTNLLAIGLAIMGLGSRRGKMRTRRWRG